MEEKKYSYCTARRAAEYPRSYRGHELEGGAYNEDGGVGNNCDDGNNCDGGTSSSHKQLLLVTRLPRSSTTKKDTSQGGFQYGRLF